MHYWTYPSRADSRTIGVLLILALIVLLCWLYNAYRIHKFKKEDHSSPAELPSKSRLFMPTPTVCIIGGILLILLAVLFL